MPSTPKKIYLFANWKMYLDYNESRELATGLKKSVNQLPATTIMAVFPSALAMSAVKAELGGSAVSLGAQNTYWVERGGYTGEVSAAMYKSVGVDYALVGHAERRNIFKETNHEVRQKIEAILACGITPVICLGDTADERKDGSAVEAIEAQLRAALTGIIWPSGRELIIAYEPVWAVGTGAACAPEEANQICGMLKNWVSSLLKDVTPIFLYGGSVRAENVADFLHQSEISGILVGGAATKLSSWQDIVSAAKQ